MYGRELERLQDDGKQKAAGEQSVFSAQTGMLLRGTNEGVRETQDTLQGRERREMHLKILAETSERKMSL